MMSEVPLYMVQMPSIEVLRRHSLCNRTLAMCKVTPAMPAWGLSPDSLGGGACMHPHYIAAVCVVHV